MFDVAVIGYGPVGSVMANLIATKGYKVLIIDENEGTSPTARAINTDGEQCSCLLYTSPSPRDQRGSRMPSCG